MTSPPRLFATDADVRLIGEGLLACTLPRIDWTHKAHLAACLWLVEERPHIAPERKLPEIIRRYNESVGGVNSDTEGYHETITQVSIVGVLHFLHGTPRQLALVAKVNALLLAEQGRRDWPLRFYSPERLFSVDARRKFVAPDLAALP